MIEFEQKEYYWNPANVDWPNGSEGRWPLIDMSVNANHKRRLVYCYFYTGPKTDVFGYAMAEVSFWRNNDLQLVLPMCVLWNGDTNPTLDTGACAFVSGGLSGQNSMSLVVKNPITNATVSAANEGQSTLLQPALIVGRFDRIRVDLRKIGGSFKWNYGTRFYLARPGSQ